VLNGTLPAGVARRMTASLLQHLYASLTDGILALSDIPDRQVCHPPALNWKLILLLLPAGSAPKKEQERNPHACSFFSSLLLSSLELSDTPVYAPQMQARLEWELLQHLYASPTAGILSLSDIPDRQVCHPSSSGAFL